MKFNGKQGGEATRRSPMYTSRDRELVKRTVIAQNGRDLDGAYRATRRIDDPVKAAR